MLVQTNRMHKAHGNELRNLAECPVIGKKKNEEFLGISLHEVALGNQWT